VTGTVSFSAPFYLDEHTINVDGDPEDLCDIGDLTALIDFLFISFTPLAECL